MIKYFPPIVNKKQNYQRVWVSILHSHGELKVSLLHSHGWVKNTTNASVGLYDLVWLRKNDISTFTQHLENEHNLDSTSLLPLPRACRDYMTKGD